MANSHYTRRIRRRRRKRRRRRSYSWAIKGNGNKWSVKLHPPEGRKSHPIRGDSRAILDLRAFLLADLEHFDLISVGIREHAGSIVRQRAVIRSLSASPETGSPTKRARRGSRSMSEANAGESSDFGDWCRWITRATRDCRKISISRSRSHSAAARKTSR